MRFFFFLSFIFISNHLIAQNVVSAAGIEGGNSGVKLSATLGEVSISTYNNGSDIVTEGFHQSNLVVLGVDDLKPDFDIKVFPNPSADVFHLDLPEFTNTRVEVYNIHGQLMLKQELNQLDNELHTEKLKNGIYFLSVFKDNLKVKTYKILKN